MRLSEYIWQLQDLQDRHGNLEVETTMWDGERITARSPVIAYRQKLVGRAELEETSNIMKNKEWYGVGLSNEDRSAKFEIWVDDMGGEDNIDIICIDGSAFDSTQHRELLQTLDQELLKVIFKEFEHEIL